ncbi:hypothetical protein M408DRAFT_244325 [Serendipita vermifera MAFF 305830]|uniref:Uncharacterized protein n=1 Tax=Serendipita vermifera MAFF 305830 TaxID=933852 RepID=A0A0C3AHQ0_SERVB|nr:hypothetical protein M408DRAFT_244325 [Serendipita vermifera MAFF 305830]
MQSPIFSVIYNLSHSTRLRAVISSAILSICLPSPTMIAFNTTVPAITQVLATELHQPSSSPLPAPVSRNITPGPEQPGFAELRYLLQNKESHNVQSGIEVLCRLTRIFRGVAQPVGGTIEKLMGNSQMEPLLQLFDLAKHPSLSAAISSTRFIELTKGQSASVRSAVASTLAKLAEHVELHEMIRPVIPSLIELLKDYGARDTAVSSLTILTEHVEFRSAIIPSVPSLLKHLKDNSAGVQSFAASTLTRLSEQVEGCQAILPLVPSLFELLKDDKSNIRSTAVSVLTSLANQVELREAIHSLVPSLVEPLKDTRSAR